MSQREFGPALGSSHRSAVRWDSGRSQPAYHHMQRLVALLVPHDLDLAAEVAAHIGQTLESLGLVAPPAPAPTTQPASLPVHVEQLVDLLVLTAMEMTGGTPAAMRAMLAAVFGRAREVGLTTEAAASALRAVIARSEASQRASSPPGE